MKPLKHVAFVQWKPGTSETLIQQLFQQLATLPKSISGIRDFTWGLNNSPEGLSDGFSHGFVTTFESAAARDAYLTHPEHQGFVNAALPHLQRVVVVDWEV